LAGVGILVVLRVDRRRKPIRRGMSESSATLVKDRRPSDCRSPIDPVVDLPVIVGRNLRRLRIRQGHSLEQLAKHSGVSRAMLGQIETGKSTPTIGLLWKVATALGVPFASLIATDDARGNLIFRRASAKLLSSSQGRFTSRALFPFDSKTHAEFYELRLAPLHWHEAQAHALGTQENLVVAKGTVEIIPGSERPVTLNEGDAILFEADVPHSYRNLGNEEAILFLVTTHI
jgi:transcriptional regulator with XRE-family HTH domain